MPTFSYKAVDNLGNQISGKQEAESKQELIKQLAEKGQFVTYVYQEKESKLSSPSFLEKIRGIKKEDISLFTTQLLTMVSAGLSLAEGLRDLSTQTENIKLQKVIKDIEDKVLAGESLSMALSHHPQVFPEMYVNMISAGEVGGALETVLERLAAFYDQEINLQQRIKTAMTYPIVLLVVAVMVIIFILVNFIPKFVVIFERMGINLPLPTLILLKVSMFLKNFGLILGLVFAGLILMSRNYIKTEPGKKQYDRLKLSLPIFGGLNLKVSCSRFLRTLGTLYSAGVPILQAIDVSRRTMGNKVLAEKLSITSQISSGESLSDPLRSTGLFPPMVIRMISTGEKAGALHQMLNKAADFYDLEIENTIERLSALLEPVILLIMGGIVALIMASTLLPMFQMVKLLRH